MGICSVRRSPQIVAGGYLSNSPDKIEFRAICTLEYSIAHHDVIAMLKLAFSVIFLAKVGAIGYTIQAELLPKGRSRFLRGRKDENATERLAKTRFSYELTLHNFSYGPMVLELVIVTDVSNSC